MKTNYIDLDIIPNPPSPSVSAALMQARARPCCICAVHDPQSSIGPTPYGLWLLHPVGPLPVLLLLHPEAQRTSEFHAHMRRLRGARKHYGDAPSARPGHVLVLEITIIENDLEDRTLRAQLGQIPEELFRVYESAHLLHPWYDASAILPEVT